MNKKGFWVLFFILVFFVGVNAFASKYDVSFSFASDESYLKVPGYGPAFTGYVQDGKNLIIGQGLANLVVDVNGKENPGGLLTFHSDFYFKGYASNYANVPLPGGGSAIHWKLEGYFYFKSTSAPLPADPLILSGKFDGALLTAYSPNADVIGQTLTIQHSEAIKGVLSMIPGTVLKCMGIKSLEKMENFAFTLTNKIKPIVKISKSGFFTEKWTSEGSFSASAIRQ